MLLSTRYFVTFVPFCVLFFNKGWVAGGSYRLTGFKTELTQETNAAGVIIHGTTHLPEPALQHCMELSSASAMSCMHKTRFNSTCGQKGFEF